MENSAPSPFSLWTTEWTLEIPGGQCRDGEDKEWDGKALSSSCYIQCVSVSPEVGCRKTRTLPLFDNDKEYKLIFCPCTYRVKQKNLAKVSDTCSVRADWLCIGCPRLVGGVKAGNSNMQDFFCTTL